MPAEPVRSPARAGAAIFDGFITGLGSTSGTRLVVGIWPRSPLGSFADVMVETADGRRVLLAPDDRIAEFVAGTYSFDEVRVERLDLRRRGSVVSVHTPSLSLVFRTGDRSPLGLALTLIPTRLARAAWWAAALDPVANALLPGVRTRGSAGNGRRETYAALDVHRVVALTGRFDGTDLGGLMPVRPPVRFGFGSVPAEPSIVRVVTTVRG